MMVSSQITTHNNGRDVASKSIDLDLDLMEAQLKRRWRRAQTMVARWKQHEYSRRVSGNR